MRGKVALTLALCYTVLGGMTVAQEGMETPPGSVPVVQPGAYPPSGPVSGLDSPGFESGPDVPIIAFTPSDTGGLLWFASNTDGERIKTAPGKPAFEGEFYASLLQNAGAYDGSPLGIGDFGFGGFDRIYATFLVNPSTSYDVTFRHAADDRFGYTGDTSVVEVVDADANSTITLRTFATPALFSWTAETFSFETGPATTSVAICLTVMGSGNTSGVFDEVVVDETIPVELESFEIER